ncbi:MAG: hypothetical protein M1829_000967 [Trizodia sp. TS-e1964]|nr:MAG: hypothetical protein M1829_000967 [Trizodia sp. TS-e1964]
MPIPPARNLRARAPAIAAPPVSDSIASSQTGRSSDNTTSESVTKKPKVRRVPTSITPIACEPCKKARAKCDGDLPCYRCLNRDLDKCIYHPHSKTTKDELIRLIKEMESLRKRDDRIFNALVSDEKSQEVVMALRSGEPRDSISLRLGRLTLEGPLPETPPATTAGWPPYLPDGMDPRSPVDEVDTDSDHGHAWTTVTNNPALVRHLLTLYFTWAHPIHMVVSETAFMRSYLELTADYCSSALVNAMCALGCLLAESPLEMSYDTELMANDPEDYKFATLAERFMEEARSLIKWDNLGRITIIQTFAIMFLVDAGSGKARRAASYISFATTQLFDRALGNEPERHTDTWKIAVLGITALGIAWDEFTHQVSNTHQLPSLAPDIELDPFLLESEWIFYRQPSDVSNPSQPSLAILTATYTAKLMFIVRATTNLFYGESREPVTGGKILQQYARYLAWKESLPKEIASVDANSQALPHVLTLHIHYHTAIVQLLRPIMDPPGVHPLNLRNPEWFQVLALQSAEDGLLLLKQYRLLFNCRHQPQIQMFCLVHLSDLIMRYKPRKAEEVVHFCLDMLKESRKGFPFCGPLQEMFRHAASDCRVLLPLDLENLMGPLGQYSIDELMEAVVKPSFAQPLNYVASIIAPLTQEQWAQEWHRYIVEPTHHVGLGSRKSSRDSDQYMQGQMQISSILNS